MGRDRALARTRGRGLSSARLGGPLGIGSVPVGLILLACGGVDSFLEPAASPTETDAAGAEAGAPPSQPPPTNEPSPDCLLPADALTSKLGGVGQEVQAPSIQDNRLTEAVRLGDGVVLSRSVGGCVHYGLSYGWSVLPLSHPTDDLRWPQITTELIAATEVLSGDSAQPSLLEGLAAAAPPVPGPTSGHQFSLPCGEAYCLLTVREEGEGRALEVVYDFAL